MPPTTGYSFGDIVLVPFPFITLIDVFLFLASVALLDLRTGFSMFSLWSAALFSFLLVYMVMVTHTDIKKY